MKRKNNPFQRPNINSNSFWQPLKFTPIDWGDPVETALKDDTLEGIVETEKSEKKIEEPEKNRDYSKKNMYNVLNDGISEKKLMVRRSKNVRPDFVELGNVMNEIYESQQKFDLIHKYNTNKAYKTWVDITTPIKEFFGSETLEFDIIPHLKNMQDKVKHANNILYGITNNCGDGLANITQTLYENIDNQAKIYEKIQGLNSEVPALMESIKSMETDLESIDKYKSPSEYATKLKDVNIARLKLRDASHKDRIVDIGEKHYDEHIDRLEKHQNIFQNISHHSKEIAFNIALYQKQLDDIIPIFEDTRDIATAVSIAHEGVSFLKEYNQRAMSAYAQSVRNIMDVASEDPYMIESDHVLNQLVGDVNSRAYKRALNFSKAKGE